MQRHCAPRMSVLLSTVALLVAGCGNSSTGGSSPGFYTGGANDGFGEVGSGGDVNAADAATPVADAGGPPDTAAVDAGTTDAGSAIVDVGSAVDVGAVADTGPVDVADSNKPCSFNGETGATGLECMPGESCLANVGTCKGKVEGLCKKLKTTCPSETNAVCGCDGNTYINVCEAQKVGMIIKSGGKCQQQVLTPCGGNTGGTCPMGQVCDIDGCDKNSSGFCYAEPPNNLCPNGGVPECACDDKTYPNGCYRRLAGVAKQHLGECPQNTFQPCMIGPAGKEVQPCPGGQFCKLDPANPQACVGKGECAPLPPVCDQTSAPVCSCGGFSKAQDKYLDSATFLNSCALAKVGMNIKSAGKCGGGTGGCTEGKGECPAGQYCGVPKGNCGSKGICIPKAPPPCPNTVSLVCGCDAKTYSNAGCAAEAGTVVKHDGPC